VWVRDERERGAVERVGGGSGGLGLAVEEGDAVKDLIDDGVVADGGVEHLVVEFAAGPIFREVRFDEGGAVAVDGIEAAVGFLAGEAGREEAAEFFLAGGVEEDAERVVTITKEVRGAAADEDAVPTGGRVEDDAFHHGGHAISVEGFDAVDGEAALEAAAEENFHQAVEERVDAFLAFFDGGDVGFRAAGDFTGEFLVPEFPAEFPGEFVGDGGAPTAVFALEGDDSDHGGGGFPVP
jgi:hypothetical protein